MTIQQRDDAFRYFAEGRLDLAERAAHRRLAVQPQDCDAINLLAVICCQQGDLDQGIRWALAALSMRDDDVQALELLGDALHTLGEFAGAAEAFRRAAAARPDLARLHAKRAYALHEGGDLEEAVQAYVAALARGGTRAELPADLGRALAKLGRLDTAIVAFRHAIALDPNLAQAWIYLAEALAATGQPEDACHCYRRGVALQPDNADAWFNLGRLLNDLARFEEALEADDRAIALRPDFAEAHSNRSAALRQLARFREAIAAARDALAIDPNHANALSNLGNALTAIGEHDAALKVHLRAIDLAPERGAILANLALTLQELGAEDDAIAILERAVALDPAKAWPQFNLALIRLKNGDFTRGWDGYRWRWKAKNRGAKESDRLQPRWNGGPLADGPLADGTLAKGRLMIHGEQGVGDEIMFAGFLPAVQATGVAATLDCDPRLQPLFARSFPGITVIGRGEAADDVAAHVDAGDLPTLFRPDQAAEPWLAPAYLSADPARVAALRQRYAGGRPLVGIAWYSANAQTGARRSIPIDRLAPFLASLDVRWVSLQYGDLGTLGEKLARWMIIDPEIDQMQDLDGFAAQVAAMDLVVTIDNSTAHLAGALGRPTLLALSYDADWRWLRGRGDTPWYPSLTLIRQAQPGDWQGALLKVQEEIVTRLEPALY
jgi:tetratricopeptide (TPR) repeat protein